MGSFIIKLTENNPSIVFLAVSACVGIGIWVGRVNSDRDTFKKFIDRMGEKIEEILQKLPSSTVAGKSPLHLTGLGEKVSEEIQASEWAKQIAPALLVRIANKHPYEVQEFCLEYVKGEDVLPEDMQEKVKTSAYQNGIEKEQVLRVLAVELRDQLLPEEKQS